MAEKLSYRMIQIGKSPAGLIGLNELFCRLYQAGVTPDHPDIASKLLEGVREHNYIPMPAVSDYAKAIERAYQEYYAEKTHDESYQVKSYGTWRGYPRQHISWFPTIAAALCDGCGRCLEFCPYGVYRRQDNGKVEVVEPFLCKVGCHSCAAVCRPEAILFPPREMLRDYRPLS